MFLQRKIPGSYLKPIESECLPPEGRKPSFDKFLGGMCTDGSVSTPGKRRPLTQMLSASASPKVPLIFFFTLKLSS